jgi:hypothetical protein
MIVAKSMLLKNAWLIRSLIFWAPILYSGLRTRSFDTRSFDSSEKSLGISKCPLFIFSNVSS